MVIGAIIQARLSSTRLPKKVVKPLPEGKPTVLEHIIRRLKNSRYVNKIVLATSTYEEDKILEYIALKENINIFFGDKENVLSRFYNASKEFNIDIICRITADNPCLDTNILDLSIKFLLDNNLDYTAVNGVPLGMEMEVFRFKCLETAYKKANKDYQKEHVTPYIHENKNKFKIGSLDLSNLFGKDIEELRLTLDTEEDYALLCSVFDYLYDKNPYFGIDEILNLFRKKPWLKLINKKIMQKKTFNSLEEEIKEAKKLLELQDLNNVAKFIEKIITKKEYLNL